MNPDDLRRGEFGEDFVHDYMKQWYDIRLADREEQRHGIDAWYTHRETGEQHSVEVKLDERSGQTGNLFVEVTSVDNPIKPGWVWTCQADQLIYWLPVQRLFVGFVIAKLQLHIREWAKRYSIKAVDNDGYQTHGVPVPLVDALAVSEWKISLG